MAKRLDSDGYWEAYGALRPTGYVPLLSLVGMARACGVSPDSNALRAYVYLASHSRSGEWLKTSDPWAYDALCEFMDRTGLLEDDCVPADVSVVTATYEQVGSMYPTHKPKSRPQTASAAIHRLIEAGAIARVKAGRQGMASLYVFLPVVWTDVNECQCHRWLGYGEDGREGYMVSDYDVSEHDESAPSALRRRPWPWD